MCVLSVSVDWGIVGNWWWCGECGCVMSDCECGEWVGVGVREYVGDYEICGDWGGVERVSERSLRTRGVVDGIERDELIWCDEG